MRNEQCTCWHEVKKVLATLVKTSETQTCTRISFEGNEDQSSVLKNHRHPWNAPKQKLIHQLYHRWQSLKCWWWCNHTSCKTCCSSMLPMLYSGSISRCTTSSSSQASGAGAASTNVVASSEWRMEVCRCIVNLISIVKLSDLQFHMCVVIEILKKVSWGACRAGERGFKGQKLLVQV